MGGDPARGLNTQHAACPPFEDAPPPSPGQALECVPSVFMAGSVGTRRYRTSAPLSRFLKHFSPSFLGPQAASPGPTQDPTVDSSRQACFPAPCSSVGSEDGERALLLLNLL